MLTPPPLSALLFLFGGTVAAGLWEKPSLCQKAPTFQDRDGKVFPVMGNVTVIGLYSAS